MLVALVALRPRAASRPAVRMNQGATVEDDDDVLRRMAQQRLLGKTDTEILESMVRSEMGLDMDLSFFDDSAPQPAPPPPPPPMNQAVAATAASDGDDDDGQGQTDSQALSDDDMETKEILEGMAEMFGGALQTDAPAAAGLPLAGEESWGRWSQSALEISLELFVDSGTAAEKVSCEVSVGFLDVRLGWMPLLSGRLGHAVETEVAWTLDEGDGRKTVCIGLEKRQSSTPYSESLRAAADTAPLFDSLRIGAREVGAPGLVKGRYVSTAPVAPSSESEEGSYGGFDGTAPDMRG